MTKRKAPADAGAPSGDRAPRRVPVHGKGQLRVGNAGGKGGSGRPPNEIRKHLRGSFADRIQILEDIADNKKLDKRLRLQALEMLAKYGLGIATTALGADGNAPPPTSVAIQLVRPGELPPAEDARALAPGDTSDDTSDTSLDDYGAGETDAEPA